MMSLTHPTFRASFLGELCSATLESDDHSGASLERAEIGVSLFKGVVQGNVFGRCTPSLKGKVGQSRPRPWGARMRKGTHMFPHTFVSITSHAVDSISVQTLGLHSS